jgi:cyclophilin family peptidyl-prolyl cis-trans isomerase
MLPAVNKRAAVDNLLFRFCALCALASACETAPPVDQGLSATIRPDSALWSRMLASEDARGSGSDGIAPLIEGLASPNPALRRIAVRALGRLETDTLVPNIAPLLQDSSADVRAEAANALGQAVLRGIPGAARSALETRFQPEADARVRGVIAETLGRLRHSTAAEVSRTVNLLVETPFQAPDTDGGAFLLGSARGLYFLMLQPAARDSLPEAALAGLRSLMRFGVASAANDSLTARRARTVAAAALVASRRATQEDVSALLNDPAPLVRREAVLASNALPAEARAAVADSAADDPSPIVRFEALRARRAALQHGHSCPQALDAVADPDAHVSILALAILGQGCGGPDAAQRLDSVAATLPSILADTTMGWQAAATALASLAAVDSARARSRIESFTASANPFVRMSAARAAARLRDTAILLNLTNDAHANVRTEAVRALFTLAGHAADSVFVAQLREEDSQLLQTAANSLEGTRNAAALPALLDALDRISSAQRETWRDARIALLRRIDALGSRASADRLQPYLQDYDSRVAGAVADILGRWTGSRPTPTPAPLSRLDLPSFAALDTLERSTVILETAAGTLEMKLLPFEAPTNAWRFARLARAGYFNGLTFHRVEPNFVLQGGSPGANEYAGDGPFTRDELGLASNWRGTVGLSTRGRDTGDAQIFINLIDNTRLDHNYTVFAEVTRGFDVMDRILEGTGFRVVIRTRS